MQERFYEKLFGFLISEGSMEGVPLYRASRSIPGHQEGSCDLWAVSVGTATLGKGLCHRLVRGSLLSPPCHPPGSSVGSRVGAGFIIGGVGCLPP